MSRLPQPGGDKGNWGTILNDFLTISHNPDGTLKASDDITDAKTKADTAVQSVNGKTGTTVTLAATDVNAEPVGLSDETQASLNTMFVSTAKLRSTNLLVSLKKTGSAARPAPMASPPTVAFATSTTITAREVSLYSNELSFYGTAALNWDAASHRVSTPGVNTVKFVLTSDQFSITWAAALASGGSLWDIFVDGVPITSTPFADTGIVTSLNSLAETKITFGSVAARLIEVNFSGVNSVYSLNVPITALVTPVPTSLRIAFEGDSFYGGASPINALQTAPLTLGRLLGATAANFGRGGTGYVSVNASTGAPVFGDPARIAAITAFSPDLIVLQGSVNDDSKAGIQAAATALLAAYATAMPGVPVIVLGPQPSNAADTISANRSANVAAVKAAALASPNVIAFHDEIGTAAGAPAAYSSTVSYNLGDLVTYKGSVWRWAVPTAESNQTPGAQRRWELMTWAYTGTGKIGSTTGDGTRDIYLASDGIHPVVEGSNALALRTSAAILADLQAFVLAS